MRARVAAGLMAFAGVASAGELEFHPYASGLYLYDSNVYKFSSQVADVTGTTDTSDRVERYTAGLDAGYAWEQQKVHATAEARRFLFEDFSHLDHNEYALDIGLDGKALSNTTGLLDFRDERRMASFEDRRSTQLIIERDRMGRGELTIAVTPDWHVVAGARLHTLRSPLPDAPALPQPPPGAAARVASPNFAMHETAYNAGVQRGILRKEHSENEAPLFVGVMLGYQTVSFSGVTPQPPPPPGVSQEKFDGYRLLSLEATAKYDISELSAFDGKLGVTQYRPRESAGGSRLELTGELGYTRSLSEVTELNLHVFRRIAPYAATGDASTNTGISVGAKWQPMLRDLIVLVNYSWASSSFGGSSGFAPENSGRGDTVQTATLSLAHPLFRYFAIRLFGSYSDRHSNRAFDSYADKIVGAELAFRWP